MLSVEVTELHLILMEHVRAILNLGCKTVKERLI